MAKSSQSQRFLDDRPKAVIFDCWNTLFYSNIGSSLHTIAKRLAHKELNYTLVKKFETAYMLEPHTTFEEPTRAFLASLHVPATPQLVSWVESKLLSSIPRQQAYEDTFAALKELRADGYKIGMITNSWKGAFDRLREKYELDNYIDEIIVSCECGLIKPDPAIFTLACERMGLSKDQVVMVGDSLKDDVLGAHAAGMRAILLDRHSYHTGEDSRITELSRLPEALAII